MDKSYLPWLEENVHQLWLNYKPIPYSDRHESGINWASYCRKVFDETGGAPVLSDEPKSKPKPQIKLQKEFF